MVNLVKSPHLVNDAARASVCRDALLNMQPIVALRRTQDAHTPLVWVGAPR